MALYRSRFSSLACLLLLGLASSTVHAADISLRMHGSNTIGARLGPDLLKAYARSKGFVGLTHSETAAQEFLIEGRRADGSKFHGIVKAHGTNTGYADLKSGAADLWMASRVANPEEVQDARTIGDLHSADQEHVIALDGLAIVVHPDNPVTELTSDQIRDAFAGRVSNWSAFGGVAGAIKLYARDQNSGTFDSFKSKVMNDGATLSSQTRRFESSSDLDQAVAADRNALGFVGFSHVALSKALAVKAAGTAALQADALSIATEDYLLARRLYLYSARQMSEPVREFVEFVQGSAGQQVTAGAGFVAQDIFVSQAQPLPGNPDGYYDVIADAERLSLNFRFRPQSATLDSRALRDIDRVSAFMNQPANRGRQLRLAAFGVSSERSPMMTLFAVNDRVDYIAQILAARGVRTEMSRGFVDGAAVAPTDRAETRARNERVEVWLAEPRSPQG